MSSVLGVYLSDHHSWDSTTNYMRALQPAWVVIHQPTARSIWRAQQAAPDAKIMLRSWDIDDHNGDRKREAYANPQRAAEQHWQMWNDLLERLLEELDGNEWQYDEKKWHLQLINEPDPAYLPQIVEYTAEWMHRTTWPLGVMVASVGNFGIPGQDPNNWSLVKPLEQQIRDGGHILVVHEYWQPEGPSFVWTDKQARTREDAGNLAWRHQHIPLDVPILVGEAGPNGFIYNRHTNTDNGGWQNYMTPQTYAAQVHEYIEGCDSRVAGVALYMTDYHDDQWKSFDTTPAHDELLAIRDAEPIEPDYVHVPAVVVDGPQIESGEEELDDSTSNLFERSMAFVRRWEGGLSLDPNDPGNYYNGQLIGTKYGINAAVWGGLYDIPNLTEQEAEAIYRQHYWQASGADLLRWPLSLIVFDTAVLHGAGTAAMWLRELGPSPLAFAAKRLDAYVNSERWHFYGNAWVRRVAELLEIAAEC